MSVIANQSIAQAQFVAQYAGELLTNSEADRRLAEYDNIQAGVGHALLVPSALLTGSSHKLRFNMLSFDASCSDIAAKLMLV